MQSNLPWIIYAHKIQHNGGSGESMFKYYLNAINKERAMETCMTCRGNGQNRLAHEIASTGHPNLRRA